MRFLKIKISLFYYKMNDNPNITIVDYKKFDFDKLTFNQPEQTKAGSFLAAAKYNNQDVFIQTPRLKCSQLVKTDNRCALELEFDKSHGLFYDYITSIDDFSIIQIQKNSKPWFNKSIPLDIVEEFYKTPVKVGRKNNPPALKIKVPLSKSEPVCTIYDNKNNEITFSKLKTNSKAVVVLKFVGLKFLKQQVICEWLPMQIKSYQTIVTPRKKVYLIRDNLLTDDESGSHVNRRRRKESNDNVSVLPDNASVLPDNASVLPYTVNKPKNDDTLEISLAEEEPSQEQTNVEVAEEEPAQEAVQEQTNVEVAEEEPAQEQEQEQAEQEPNPEVETEPEQEQEQEQTNIAEVEPEQDPEAEQEPNPEVETEPEQEQEQTNVEVDELEPTQENACESIIMDDLIDNVENNDKSTEDLNLNASNDEEMNEFNEDEESTEDLNLNASNDEEEINEEAINEETKHVNELQNKYDESDYSTHFSDNDDLLSEIDILSMGDTETNVNIEPYTNQNFMEINNLKSQLLEQNNQISQMREDFQKFINK